MLKKHILVGVAIGVLLTTLSACSKSGAKGADTTKQPASKVTSSETNKSVEKDVIKGDAEKKTIPLKAPEPVKVFEGKAEKVTPITDVAVYAEYANKILSGTQVIEAVTRFKGKRMAVLLATSMLLDGTTAFNTPDGNIDTDVPTVGASGTAKIFNTSGKDIADKLTFVNYGALLKGTKGKAMLKFDIDHFVAEGGLDGADDSYVVNANIANVTKAGSAEHVSSYTRMQSYLVKDSKGGVIGIACYAVK